MKKEFKQPLIEVIKVETKDVITTSLGIHNELPENDDPDNQF